MNLKTFKSAEEIGRELAYSLGVLLLESRSLTPKARSMLISAVCSLRVSIATPPEVLLTAPGEMRKSSRDSIKLIAALESRLRKNAKKIESSDIEKCIALLEQLRDLMIFRHFLARILVAREKAVQKLKCPYPSGPVPEAVALAEDLAVDIVSLPIPPKERRNIEFQVYRSSLGVVENILLFLRGRRPSLGEACGELTETRSMLHDLYILYNIDTTSALQLCDKIQFELDKLYKNNVGSIKNGRC